MKQKINKTRKSNQNASHLALHIAIGLACESVFLAILICGFAQIISKADVPLAMILPMTTVLCCIATLGASLVFARIHKKNNMLWGLFFGGVLFLILWVMALSQGQTAFGLFTALKGSCILICGALGGLIGTMLCERNRKIR